MLIDRIVETERPEFARQELFPDATSDQWRPYESVLERSLDPASGDLVLAIQSFLIRTPRDTILIDTCVGDHKKRWRKAWTDTTSGTFLRRLEAVGVDPAEVDLVVCTHLHADHVGWNTTLAGGKWSPTFPNARYVISRSEWAHWEGLQRTDPRDQITDSVLPIINSGQAELVDDDHAVTEEVRLLPSPGHTPHHVSVGLASGAAAAVVTGDLIHHPVQCSEPGWRMSFDHDAVLAIRTRRDFLKRYADTDVLICASHFPSPSFGKVVRVGTGYAFEFDDGGG